MNLYDITLPQMSRTLGQARRWLDKAQAHAEHKKYDPQALLLARLAPDQWHLTRQYQTFSASPVRLAAFLRGADPPSFVDLEPSLDALRARLDEAREQLARVTADDVKAAAERVVPLPFLPGKGMLATDFVVQFSLPNFYFHVTTAYAILRHNGVDLGKMDYIGELALRDL